MKVGIIGGGQLGRMMAQANIRNNLGYTITVLDPTPNCPAAQIPGVTHIIGDFKDEEKIRTLAKEVDVLTFEIELANSSILKEIETTGVRVAPSPETLHTIQDKLRQKTFLQTQKLPVGAFTAVQTRADIEQGIQTYGLPVMLKATQDSYDGRGNYLITNEKEIDIALETFNGRSLLLEKYVDFEKELSVIAARDTNGTIKTYPVGENHHVNSQLATTIAPAPIPEETKKQAETIAYNTMKAFTGAGVFGIELFLDKNGEILINEIAPRVHNSGHHTIEGNNTCQFEQHLRAITGKELGSTNQKQPVIMHNILGENEFNGAYDIQETNNLPPDVGIHMYGKESRPQRKLGHITIPTTDKTYAKQVRDSVKLIPKEGRKETPTDKDIRIEVRVGSNSDLPKIKELFELFDDLEIPYSPRILSAHRTPQRMSTEAQQLKANGFRTSISAAGGSAHLAGMTASETTLPIIALPVKSSLGGEDALLSMAQMPPGIPNGTVGIGEARHAGILATRIAYLDDETMRNKLSKELNTKITTKLTNTPELSIVSSLPTEELKAYTTFAEELGINCTITKEPTSPIALYIDHVAIIPSLIKTGIEQLTIIAPIEETYDLRNLPKLITGPYAWMGINRVKNGILYAAEILGIYFEKVREKREAYQNKLYKEVVAKDTRLQEEGITNFLE